MDFVPVQSLRERIAKNLHEITVLEKNASTLEHSIVINRRKNTLLTKDVQELRKRREEQLTAMNKEENRIFSLARALSESEDRITQIELELEETLKVKQVLETEIAKRAERIEEPDLLLGLYEGCAMLW
ncbi:hypothetical protein NEFER03_0581 [Nematocida sp. LUAm3]|nr:hypothetical protein NEFER03_0581 [Nematocida sp. LUAm3]KAI5175548.1 hypothetical protein NEFER02_1454 [Nematocida sp. LUAm2]KAI5178422.1 hypothetical protein NEFER01_1569 [Nematocida sp. LUAm1]